MLKRLVFSALVLTSLVAAVPASGMSAAPPTETARVFSAHRVKRAIRIVWGPNWREVQAITVAACESTFNTHAVNGQYRGIFQMGEWERATYGHGWTPRAQARAAHRYFVASGRDWSPWECKP